MHKIVFILFLGFVCLTRNFVSKQSRLSPFANTRGRKQRKEGGDMLEMKSVPELSTSKSENVRRWFPFIDAATLSRKRELLPVKKLRSSLILNSKLHRTLYGFIVFEVEWNDVRGINYFNELQVKLTSFGYFDLKYMLLAYF